MLSQRYITDIMNISTNRVGSEKIDDVRDCWKAVSVPY
ncbi:hypothetical protein MMC2321_02838 [Chitinophaga sp. MM2321]